MGYKKYQKQYCQETVLLENTYQNTTQYTAPQNECNYPIKELPPRLSNKKNRF